MKRSTGGESPPPRCLPDREGGLAHHALGRAVRLVALLNLGYFGVEFGVALRIGSVSLFLRLI